MARACSARAGRPSVRRAREDRSLPNAWADRYTPAVDFTTWFVVNFLAGLGWPRRKGFFRRQYVVSASLVDQSIIQLVRVAMGLGVGRPVLGAQLIADLFSARNWEAQGTAELFEMIDWSDVVENRPDAAPWVSFAATTPQMAELVEDPLQGTIPFDLLAAPGLQARFTIVCSAGAFFGLTHAGAAADAFDTERREYDSVAPDWIERGLRIPDSSPVASNEEFFADCGRFIEAYESSERPLVPVPEQMRIDPALSDRL